MILPFTCYCSRGDLLSHTVWPKYFCFIAILMGLTISLFCLHDWLSKVSSESFCMATSQMPANVKYFYLGKILNNNKEYFATYLINWQQVSKMTVFGKSISGRVSLKKRLKSGKKTAHQERYQCWKVYMGFRATYARIQTISFSKKALHISARPC